MKPLILYTLRPESVLARTFVQYLSTSKRPVQLRPLSEMPAPLGWEQRLRLRLQQEQQTLRQAIGGLEMGIALAAAAPHRFPDGPRWTDEKKNHERRLKVVEWKLEQLTQVGEEGRP